MEKIDWEIENGQYEVDEDLEEIEYIIATRGKIELEETLY